eukprot:scaffold75503_cov23-Tisochrysis_lutea.AAC.1
MLTITRVGREGRREEREGRGGGQGAAGAAKRNRLSPLPRDDSNSKRSRSGGWWISPFKISADIFVNIWVLFCGHFCPPLAPWRRAACETFDEAGGVVGQRERCWGWGAFGHGHRTAAV